MNEQKRTRMAAAITVNVILLLVILVVVLIYQMIYIPYAKNYRNNLKSEYDKVLQDTEEAQDYLEFLKTEEGKIYTLFEWGYVFQNP